MGSNIYYPFTIQKNMNDIEKGKYTVEDIKGMAIVKNSLNRSRLQKLVNYAKNSDYKE